MEISTNSIIGFILAIGIAQAVFFSILLLNKRARTLPDYILSVWLLILAAHISSNYLELIGLQEKYPHLIGSTSSLIFLYGPLLFMYVDCFASQTPIFRTTYLLHFIPFIGYNILMIPFYLISGDYKQHFVQEMLRDNPPLVAVIALGLRTVTLPVYIILSLIILRRYQSNIKKYFSNTEEIDLQWLRYLIWSIAGIWVMVLLSSTMKIATNFSQAFLQEIFVFVAVAIWIFAIGYYGLKHTPVFIEPFKPKSSPRPNSEETSRYEKSKIESEQSEVYLKQVMEIMELEKPYTKSRLTINELSQKLEIPSHHLSQVINDKLHQNFFDFVNNYRINEAKKQLVDPSNKHLTILGIAFDSGFNSKASFNRIFKKYTGQTPSEFLTSQGK